MRYLLAMVLVLMLLVGCAQTVEQPEPQEQVQEEPEPEVEEPEVEEEPEEPEEVVVEEPEETIPEDIKEILDSGAKRLKSYSYKYTAPGIDLPYEIDVKGSKIKITFPKRQYKEDKTIFYNTIYLDTEEKTAQAYCIGHDICLGNEGTEKIEGKVDDLDYEEAYIETPLDWLGKITEASKIDERMIENRDAVYLDTNVGKITVESYYGHLYKIEDGDDVIEFKDAHFNSVSDDDIVP